MIGFVGEIVSLVAILFTQFCLFVHVQTQSNPGPTVPSLKEKNTGSIGCMLRQFRIGWVDFRVHHHLFWPDGRDMNCRGRCVKLR
jgi:hypothetical protein